MLLLIAGFNVVMIGFFLAGSREYTIRIPDSQKRYEEAEVIVEDPSVVEYTGKEREGDAQLFHFRAAGKGSSEVGLINISPERPEDSDGREIEGYTEKRVVRVDGEETEARYFVFEVNALGMLKFCSPTDFNRWPVLMLDVMITMIAFCALLLESFLHGIRRDLYSYTTLQSGGLLIFLAVLTLMIVGLSILVLPRYQNYNLDILLTYIRYAFEVFVICAIPFILIFSISLTISNLQLIRKEGYRKKNLLGIGISLVLIAGVFICIILPNVLHALFRNMPVNDFSLRAQYVLLAVFSFFLSFMLSTMICGLIAARHVPKPDKDFIIILGCGIKKDGTLFPLIQGRVDRAVWFWKRQLELTGKKAVFIPSGGQGPDEPCAEAEAMKRYLLEQGIPEECIIPETESKTTLQNMQFSRTIIEERKKDAGVIFSTTNYHVFRSGVLAGEAGLKAEGIGSRTKWYFWPNAFVRECVGLVYNSRKLIIALFAIVALSAVILSLLL